MNYELAKQLKDAGFPKDYTQWNDHDEQLLINTWDMYGKRYSPTLSELIESCGEGFKGLLPNGWIPVLATDWTAVEKIGTIEKNDAGGLTFDSWHTHSGKTPEEAVANLYIALHKK